MEKLRLKLKKPDRILKFDDSDLTDCQSSMAGSLSPSPPVPIDESQVVLPRSVPNHLLLISTLEQLCFMYSKGNTKQAQDIFKSICEQLTKLNVVSPLLVMDEMSSLRSQYRHSVHRMLVAAIHKSNKSMIGTLQPLNGFNRGSTYLPAILAANIPMTPVSSPDEIINQTSRYNTEFVEVDKIGKGGFGAVFKSRNKLDGNLYAVKKVKFKHAKPEVWYRVLREVKALASLQHTNIVGYNAAWLEYGSSSIIKTASRVSIHDNHVSTGYLSDSTEDTGVIFSNSVGSEVDSDDGIFDGGNGWPGHGPRIRELNLESFENKFSKNEPSRTFNSASNVFFRSRSSNNMSKSSTGICNMKDFFDSEQKSNHTEFSDINFNQSHDTFSKDTTHITRTDTWSEVVSHKKCKEKTEVKQSVEFTLDTTTCETSVQGSSYGRQIVRRRPQFRRSISCDPLASGEIIIPDDDQQFVEESFPLQKSVTLYIQMELCSHTLREWMQQRNESCSTEAEFIDHQDTNMIIFRQILKAVEYIHSQGVIHRDLKPRNIFLQEEGLHVKVGDFGLATEDLLTPTFDVETINFNYSSKLLRAASTLSDHTTGVGTLTYAAPEQLLGSLYNTKCDIYSLGVILFELFQNYCTEMERYKSLEDFRKGFIPDNVFKNWPIQASKMIVMTSKDPEERPSVKELLAGELFLSKDQKIEEMTLKEILYKREIETLKKLVADKDKIIRERDRTIEELIGTIDLTELSGFNGTSV